MVAENGIGDLYELLNWLTGDELYTHQLGRAADVCGPWLVEQHPVLECVTLPEGRPDARGWCDWLESTKAAIASELTLRPLPADRWTTRNPLDELLDMRTRSVRL
jgi:hypothetical protein